MWVDGAREHVGGLETWLFAPNLSNKSGIENLGRERAKVCRFMAPSQRSLKALKALKREDGNVHGVGRKWWV